MDLKKIPSKNKKVRGGKRGAEQEKGRKSPPKILEPRRAKERGCRKGSQRERQGKPQGKKRTGEGTGRGRGNSLVSSQFSKPKPKRGKSTRKHRKRKGLEGGGQRVEKKHPLRTTRRISWGEKNWAV